MPADQPSKIGNEITVRISLTFQEAPEIHTLLAMTPVRERGKLVRIALKRYIKDTRHPAGDVEQQIGAVSAWLRSRNLDEGGQWSGPHEPPRKSAPPVEVLLASEISDPEAPELRQDELKEAETSQSVNRWLNT